VLDDDLDDVAGDLSRRWTAVGALMPLAVGIAATFVIAQIARLAGA
jgi:hypothetical protein